LGGVGWWCPHRCRGQLVRPAQWPNRRDQRLLASLLETGGEGRSEKLLFLLGILLAPLLWMLFATLPAMEFQSGWIGLLVAGMLVGVGTRYGSGCTSGHGVCGISRLSPRSIVATVAFMVAGFATVYVLRHLLGG